MLKDKFTFKVEYEELVLLCAHLKAIQQRALITPHNRPEGKSLELLLCSIIKGMTKRIDAKLFDYQSTVRIDISKQEALAFHCAYKYNWLTYLRTSQTIFETIDKQI